MGLLPLSREGCSSTRVLIDQFISLVEKRSCLVESTKCLLRHMEVEVVDISDRPPAILAMFESYESVEFEARIARQSSPDYLKDDHTDPALAVEGDSLSSSQSNSSSSSWEKNGEFYHSPPAHYAVSL